MICVVLKDFTDTTEFMSTKSHVSCSEVYPILFGLLSGCLKRKSDGHSIIVKVKSAVHSEIVARSYNQPDSVETAT